jgi:tetratricopeptide (TPR) repeat protein
MYCLIGLLMIAKNAPMDETLEFCEAAYDYDSDNRDNIDNLLVCYLKTNNFEKAQELADDLTETYPSFVEGWYHSAQVYAGLGDNKKALECIGKAKESDRTYLTTVSEDEIESLEANLR